MDGFMHGWMRVCIDVRNLALYGVDLYGLRLDLESSVLLELMQLDISTVSAGFSNTVCRTASSSTPVF